MDISNLCMINGKIDTIENSKISITDRGFLFGHGIFETLLVIDGKIREWDDHYSRMQQGCLNAQLSCLSSEELYQHALKLIHEFSQMNKTNPRLSLKIFITGGNYSELALPIEKNQIPASNFYILCQAVKSLPIEKRLEGYKVKSYPDKRGDFFKEIKSLNYLYNSLCLNDSRQNGFDDALLFNEKNELTEGVTSSFIWFSQDNEIFTTPPEGKCLAGTSVLRLQRALLNTKITMKYKALSKNETTNAQGCALLSSVRGIVPIVSIDDTQFDIIKHINFFKNLIEIFDSCE